MIRFHLADRLRDGETVLLGWASSGNAATVEAMASAGYVAICLDQQHGLFGYQDTVSAVRAMQAFDTAPCVRIAHGALPDVGRMLDLGVEAIIAPMINSSASARDLVNVAKYPPIGGRSWGPARLRLLIDMSGVAGLVEANEAQLLFAMVETSEAIEALDEISEVDGIDGIFVGPSDLGVSLSKGAALALTSDEMTETLSAIVRGVRVAGKVPGIYASTLAQARHYRDLGFKLIALGADLSFVSQGAKETLAAF